MRVSTVGSFDGELLESANYPWRLLSVLTHTVGEFHRPKINAAHTGVRGHSLTFLKHDHRTARQILHRITMAARSGSFVGVIGPNGSGKSTILRCLYRALSPSAGAIRVDGRNIHSISMRDNARHVAALTQTPGFHLEFTVTDVVRTGRLPHRAALSIGHTADDGRVCAQAMADADVTHLKHRSFGSLSGGEAQRVLIARAFANSHGSSCSTSQRITSTCDINAVRSPRRVTAASPCWRRCTISISPHSSATSWYSSPRAGWFAAVRRRRC